MSNEPKIYVGTGKIKDWENGPPSLDFSFTEKDVETLREHLEDGWVRIRICQRKSPSDKGQTHYATVNTWKPDRNPDERRSDGVDQNRPPATVVEQFDHEADHEEAPF
jgi:hypothetical protein